MPVSNVGAELLINTTTAKSQTDPAVAALNDGGFVAVWTDWSQTGTDSSGSAIRGQLYDASANKVGSEFLVNSKTVDSQYIPSVCSLSSGGFAVSWLDETSVRGQVFGAGGSRVGGEIIIADYGANGGINPFTTNVSRPSPRMTALSGGGFAVTWGLGRDAYGQVYDAAGLKVGAEFSLDSVSGQRSNLGMATLANGRFVVVSTQERSGEPTSFDVRAQIFDANGGKVGAGFQVSTTSGGDLPAVAALSNGNVVVTWSSTSPIGNDTSGSSVHGQMYDAAGAKVGGEFLVNTKTAGSQTRPSVAGGEMAASSLLGRTTAELAAIRVAPQCAAKPSARWG